MQCEVRLVAVRSGVWPCTDVSSLQSEVVTWFGMHLQDRLVKLWNPHRGIAIKTYTGGHEDPHLLWQQQGSCCDDRLTKFL